MTLINQASGGIIGKGSAGLTLNTGSNTIANAGLIEADGDALTIVSALANNGKLYALSGTLTLDRAVTGTGVAYISAGTLVADNAFSQTVTFVGGKGVLQLARSREYGGRIVGFSTTGASTLDLRDIRFVNSGQATFSGTTAGGVLSVTDGIHTTKITLVGNYTASTWMASSDRAGGVIVVDTPGAPHTQTFVAAMAGMESGGAHNSVTSALSQPVSPPALAQPAH